MERFSTTEVTLKMGNGYYFELQSSFSYISTVLGTDILVRPFKTDLSSHPWWTFWLIPARGRFNLPSILHDYLLQHSHLFPNMSRKDKDMAFIEALEDAGVKPWRCFLMRIGVRLNSIWREARR